MSTTETTPAMTAEDHVREAQRYAARADEQDDAASYGDALRRTNDLQAAQVHATLAQTLKAAELMPMMAAIAEWIIRLETPASGGETGEPAP